jgi:hypothetical protein
MGTEVSITDVQDGLMAYLRTIGDARSEHTDMVICQSIACVMCESTEYIKMLLEELQ